jgi:hypothetical protein
MITVPSEEAMRDSNEAPDQRGGGTACGRLDSWKEIAAYFQRSVRCVQRWERTEGLPVLRHQHAAGATVYAYRDALDEWLHKGRGNTRNSAVAESGDGRFLQAPKGLIRRMCLEPLVHEAVAFLRQNVLRTFRREKVLRPQSPR